MYKWAIVYVVGNTYKIKYLYASTSEIAIKKSRLKNVVDLYMVDESNKRLE